jgi:magnesium chelatase subunit D
MNPEEGELRPQLLDRFGLFVQVQGLDDPVQRATVIRRNLEYEDNPAAFVRSWKQKEMESRDSILKAREVLSKVVCPDEMYNLAAQMALDFGVHGHRTDLLLIKTAKTIAAFRGYTQVTAEDFSKAASFVLPHRVRTGAYPSHEHDTQDLQQLISEWSEEKSSSGARKSEYDKISGHSQLSEPKEAPKRNVPVGEPFAVRHLSVAPKRSPHPRRGRRSKTEAYLGSGKHIGSIMPQSPSMDVAFDATLRAAAPYQIHRDRGNLAIAIEYPDLREKRKTKRVAHTILFLVDASGSMDANHRMVQTKAAILSLLNDAYKRRDRVGMVTFNGNKARVALPPTPDKEKAKRMLQRLPVGGRTPLSMGLSVAQQTLKKYALKMKNEILLLVVVSDGKANVTMNSLGAMEEAREEVLTYQGLIGKYRLQSFCEFVYSHALQEAEQVAAEIRRSGVKSVVIDTAISGRRGQMRKLCASLGGQYFEMEELRADRLVDIVNSCLNRHNSLVLL